MSDNYYLNSGDGLSILLGTVVSVVIPTYNRGAKLAETIRSLLENQIGIVEKIEIVVVDDGSLEPIAPIVEAVNVSLPFELRCMRQKNAGPAAARNAGFRASSGEIVIFVDDDIIAPPDLILKHVEAHRTNPGCVICGRCPFVKPDPLTPLFDFINSLGYDAGQNSDEEFVTIDVVASGQISVERGMFNETAAVYKDNLATPAAEEFELSLRLRERGIPILLATGIVALHDHPVKLDSLCRQQYKHAVGCAEVTVKYPDTLVLCELANVINKNLDTGKNRSLVWFLATKIKHSLATKPLRKTLLKVAEMAEHIMPYPGLLAILYRAAIGAHFSAGVREGLAQYSTSGTRM